MKGASPVRGDSSLCRDLEPIKKVSYFCVRDHMRSELLLSEISVKRADDFIM